MCLLMGLERRSGLLSREIGEKRRVRMHARTCTTMLWSPQPCCLLIYCPVPHTSTMRWAMHEEASAHPCLLVFHTYLTQPARWRASRTPLWKARRAGPGAAAQSRAVIQVPLPINSNKLSLPPSLLVHALDSPGHTYMQYRVRKPVRLRSFDPPVMEQFLIKRSLARSFFLSLSLTLTS
jgi:hypothetical protein